MTNTHASAALLLIVTTLLEMRRNCLQKPQARLERLLFEVSSGSLRQISSSIKPCFWSFFIYLCQSIFRTFRLTVVSLPMSITHVISQYSTTIHATSVRVPLPTFSDGTRTLWCELPNFRERRGWAHSEAGYSANVFRHWLFYDWSWMQMFLFYLLSEKSSSHWQHHPADSSSGMSDHEEHIWHMPFTLELWRRRQ